MHTALISGCLRAKHSYIQPQRLPLQSHDCDTFNEIYSIHVYHFP